jgi:hypothetical protein
MKFVILLAGLSIIVLSNSDCKKRNAETTYKGRLEIAGICMNYTIQLLEGNLDSSKINSTWTDEVSGKKYKNVFRLENPCDFPQTIKEGNEFSFIIDTTENKPCAVCEAYYPTPSKSLPIKVVVK